MIDVALAGDVVMSNAIMRQADDRFLPAAPSQLAGIVGEWLANAHSKLSRCDRDALRRYVTL